MTTGCMIVCHHQATFVVVPSPKPRVPEVVQVQVANPPNPQGPLGMTRWAHCSFFYRIPMIPMILSYFLPSRCSFAPFGPSFRVQLSGWLASHISFDSHLT